jgi:hypothetical protein
MNLQNYIDLIKYKLNTSVIIDSFRIVDERILFSRGYFRARLILKNDDFLEIAESFTVIDNRLVTLSYRYQWMDGKKQQLKKRWDNVEHFPDLPNFPHHVHIGIVVINIEELSQWTDEQVFAKTGKHLDSLQKSILEGVLQYQDFNEIKDNNGYSYDHIRKEASKLWKLLSKVFEKDIRKSNVRSILENKFVNTVYSFDNSSPIVGNYIKGDVNVCGEKSRTTKPIVVSEKQH